MMLLQQKWIVLFCALAATLGGCKQSQRGTRVGGSAATLTVELLNMKEPFIGRGDLKYTLSECMNSLDGVLKDKDHVEFKSAGIRTGLADCQLKITTATLPEGISVVEGTNSPDGNKVLFWARKFKVERNISGELIAKAELQQLFQNSAAPSSKSPAEEKTQDAAKKPATGETPPTNNDITVITSAERCGPMKVFNEQTRICE